jgi:HD-like signal output (HDOD) protein
MDAFIADRLRQIEFLPTFPHIVEEVMDVLSDSKSSVSDLVRCMDPSLVGEVLKVANDAYSGRKGFRGIATVEQAVAAIGYANLSVLIPRTPFVSTVEKGDILFDRKGFMRHSISCAILGKTISSAFRMGNPNTVYVSGMLHDIGIVVIYQHFKQESERIDALIREKRLSRLAAEREVLSIDHAGLGALLLEVWGIPGEIVESVKLHHSPEEIGEKEDPYVTWLANSLAKETDFERDLSDFPAFFGRQREMLQAEMPEQFLLKSHMELFEAAFDQLRGIESILNEAPRTEA